MLRLFQRSYSIYSLVAVGVLIVPSRGTWDIFRKYTWPLLVKLGKVWRAQILPVEYYWESTNIGHDSGFGII